MKRLIGLLFEFVVILMLGNVACCSADRIKDAQVGSHLFLGRHLGTEIEWRVLRVVDDRKLLVSEYAIDCLKYDALQNGEMNWAGNTWEDCSLRKWLNGEFINRAFSKEEREYIVEVENVNENNPINGNWGGNKTKDRVFLLSQREAWNYFVNNYDRKCVPTRYAYKKGATGISDENCCIWWLRSPGDDCIYAAVVTDEGEIVNFGRQLSAPSTGVRPAMWVSHKVVLSAARRELSDKDKQKLYLLEEYGAGKDSEYTKAYNSIMIPYYKKNWDKQDFDYYQLCDVTERIKDKYLTISERLKNEKVYSENEKLKELIIKFRENGEVIRDSYLDYYRHKLGGQEYNLDYLMAKLEVYFVKEQQMRFKLLNEYHRMKELHEVPYVSVKRNKGWLMYKAYEADNIKIACVGHMYKKVHNYSGKNWLPKGKLLEIGLLMNNGRETKNLLVSPESFVLFDKNGNKYSLNGKYEQYIENEKGKFHHSISPNNGKLFYYELFFDIPTDVVIEELGMEVREKGSKYLLMKIDDLSSVILSK